MRDYNTLHERVMILSSYEHSFKLRQLIQTSLSIVLEDPAANTHFIVRWIDFLRCELLNYSLKAYLTRIASHDNNWPGKCTLILQWIRPQSRQHRIAQKNVQNSCRQPKSHVTTDSAKLRLHPNLTLVYISNHLYLLNFYRLQILISVGAYFWFF